MLIVAGGTEDGSTSLDSTELFIENKWTPGESLPHALRGLRGYSLDGYFYIFGTTFRILQTTFPELINALF